MSISAISSVTEKSFNAELYSPQQKSSSAQSKGLSPEEEQQVKDLKQRDAEVRQHEQAHLAVAGPYAKGGAKFEYKTGPDGKRYASGGEVGIDTTPVDNDPAATIKKAQTIKKAALAPAEPSDQDYRVAAQADQMEQKARQELATQNTETGQSYNQQGQKSTLAAQSKAVNLLV